MTSCTSCGTTLFLDGPTARQLGTQGEMHDAPLLVRLGDHLTLQQDIYRHTIAMTVMGHARFSYGRGFWDEFWGLDDKGRSCWLSVDEGDLVLQWPVPAGAAPRHRPPFHLSETLRYDGVEFRVVEVETATCEALRGSFGEVLEIAEQYSFVNAQSEDGRLLSVETWPGGVAWFSGCWIDPFDVVVNAAARGDGG